MKLSRLASIALAGTASLALAGSAVAQTVVMSGLDNPRGLAFAPNGALYVAEAGRGGAGPCVVNSNTGETRCFGKSGAITRLWKGKQSHVAQGLESHALPDGSSAIGPNDISFQGTGGAYVTLGLGGDRAFQEALGGKFSGTLIHMAASGKWKVVADIAAARSRREPGRRAGRFEPIRRSRRARRSPGRRCRSECVAPGRRQWRRRDGGRVSADAESHLSFRTTYGRVRPDCRRPRRRRHPLRRPADRFSLRPGTGKHLPGGSGTGPR